MFIEYQMLNAYWIIMGQDDRDEKNPSDKEETRDEDKPFGEQFGAPEQTDHWYTAEPPFLGDLKPVKGPSPGDAVDAGPEQSGKSGSKAPASAPISPRSQAPDVTVAMQRTPDQGSAGSPPTPTPQDRTQSPYRERPIYQPVRPPYSPPRKLDSGNRMPRPVPERTGYVAPSRRPSAPPQRPATPPQPYSPVGPATPRPRGRRLQRFLLRVMIAVPLVLLVLLFAGAAVAAVGYVYIGQQLPPAAELWGRQTAWVSSAIYDRNGALLWELLDPYGGRRTRVTVDLVSQYMLDATVGTEDETFWEHRGFSPFAIARAVYQNLRAREIVSGFSTITQQVARNLLMSPEERGQESASRKIKEVILAVEIERRYEKDQILEIYLNENNYGNLAYGIEAAAQTYFQKSATDLNLAEASLLAGLPQSPALHDPLINPDGALARQRDVLRLMVEATQAGHLKPGITQEQAAAAAAEMVGRVGTLKPPRSDIPAPHFVQQVREQVEAEFGPDLLYRGAGLRIHTTLDPELQRIAEEEVRTGVENLVDRNVTNGALVAIAPDSGEILAMVGSVDFNDESIDGQVNVATRCRQPGSSIKPLTFLAAFEQGWTPSTLIWDVKTEYPYPPNPPYVPVNYDEKYHGNTLLRSALANSYNVPAVKALEFVGVNSLLAIADRLGVVSLRHPEQNCPEYPYEAPPDYGLSLTLGGGETKLLEMAGAYAVFANDGIRVPPTAIRYIENANGDLIADFRDRPGGRIVSAQNAYLITNILSDYGARCPAFGCPNTLQLDDRVAAAKTGTTTDFRDAWAIGYTPELVAGVWVGNSDNAPMTDVPGSRGAGPVWKSFMTRALANVPPSVFERPPGIVEREICRDSGTLPSSHCPNKRLEIFDENRPPLDASHDLWQTVPIDSISGLRANELCLATSVDKVFFVVPSEDKGAREWAIANGYEQPPDEFCSAATPPRVNITSPHENEAVPQALFAVRGMVQLPNFDRYDVTFGVGSDPQAWGWVSGPHLSEIIDGELTVWDTTHLTPGPYTLRVVAYTRDGGVVESRVIVNVVSTESAPPSGREVPPPAPTSTP